ncbi:MAG TPA: RNA-binding protein [Candidatus Paceibacterota bacterium]|nr:RNA-binding protein [Candidatus Paceibacterota bacterium]
MTEDKKTNQKRLTQKEDSEKRNVSEILIGNKPLMKYVIASLIQIKNENSAIIKARGKFISKAVDVAEVTRKNIKEKEDIEINHKINIGTDEFTNSENKKISVSTIEIRINK